MLLFFQQRNRRYALGQMGEIRKWANQQMVNGEQEPGDPLKFDPKLAINHGASVSGLYPAGSNRVPEVSHRRRLPSGPVDNLTFTRDGHWLATEGKIWDVTTSREIARLPQASLYLSSAAFSADSRWLATVGRV